MIIPCKISNRARYGIGLFCIFFLIYLLTHDNLYYIDALIFAGTIEQNIYEFLSLKNIFEWNHFLWLPTMRAVFQIQDFLGLGLRGYQTLQFFNSLAGALGLVFFFYLSARNGSLRESLLWACLLGFSHVYWYRSVGGENHLFGGLMLLPLAFYLLNYQKKQSLRAIALLSFFAVLSFYYHIGNGIAFFSVLFVLFFERKKTLWKDVFFFILFYGILISPYFFTHDLFTINGIKRWLIWATSLAHGISPDASPIGGFVKSRFSLLIVWFPALVKSFLFLEFTPSQTWIPAILWFLIVFFLIKKTKMIKGFHELLKKPEFRVFVGCFLPIFILYLFWMPGNYRYWIAQPIFLYLILSISMTSKKKRFLYFSLSGLVLIQILVNFSFVIYPQIKSPHIKPMINFSRQVKKHTPPKSPIIIVQGSLKAILPYFSGRKRISIDLAAINNFEKGTKGSTVIRRQIENHLANCIPVYLIENVFNQTHQWEDWGMSEEDFQYMLEPFSIIELPNFKSTYQNLFLIWDKNLSKHNYEHACQHLIEAGLSDQCQSIIELKLGKDRLEQVSEILGQFQDKYINNLRAIIQDP